jgi:hypothetical protein
VRGDAYTNTAECRFSLMKRAVYGAHHSISEAHLPRYLAEWDFKWNARKMKDGDRAARALKGAEGKRLTYRQPGKAANTRRNAFCVGARSGGSRSKTRNLLGGPIRSKGVTPWHRSSMRPN